MVVLAYLYSFATRLFYWLKGNPWVAVTFLLSLVAFGLIFCKREKPKPVIDIVSPQNTVNQIQRERDENIRETFNAVDERRRRDDERIKETRNRPRRKGDVNAGDLENMLR